MCTVKRLLRTSRSCLDSSGASRMVGYLTDGSSTKANSRLRLASRLAQLAWDLKLWIMRPGSRPSLPSCPTPHRLVHEARGTYRTRNYMVPFSRKRGRSKGGRKSNDFRFNMAPETCTSNGNNQGPGQALREAQPCPVPSVCVGRVRYACTSCNRSPTQLAAAAVSQGGDMRDA